MSGEECYRVMDMNGSLRMLVVTEKWDQDTQANEIKLRIEMPWERHFRWQ